MDAVRIVLGIDAAWTATEPSGVALCCSDGMEWRCVAAAPSYEEFLGLARGEAIDWTRPRFRGSRPGAAALLDAARRLSGAGVDVVAVDMPLATVPINGCRAADRAVTRQFGGRGCGAHSPSAVRPGALGAELASGLFAAGYPLGTAGASPGMGRHSIEVYPHPALLSLLPCDYRWPYKVSKSNTYWPGTAVSERAARLVENLGRVRAALADVFGPVDVPLPRAGAVPALSGLKRCEDALDALICAWVGTRFLAGEAVPLGDETAAIWCPRDVVRDRRLPCLDTG